MNGKIFESELGDVTLRSDKIKRKQRRGDWSKIKSEFAESKLVDHADFREITDTGLSKGSYYTILKLKINGERKQMFFKASDNAEKLFNRLEYLLKVYQENH